MSVGETGAPATVLRCFEREGHGTILDMDDLRARLTMNPNTLRGVVGRLKRAKQIVCVGKARYMLAPKPSAMPAAEATP